MECFPTYGFIVIINVDCNVKVTQKKTVKMLCRMRNAEFDHVYFVELQMQNVRLSVGSRELL